MEHTFTWASSLPTKVVVTGTFDDWKSTLHLEKEESGKFSGKAVLPWGAKVQYKYLVDDEWQVNSQEATEADSEGNLNNVLNVPTEAEYSQKQAEAEAQEQQQEKEKKEIPDVVGGITAGVAGLATAAAATATGAVSEASAAVGHAIHPNDSESSKAATQVDATKDGLTAAPINDESQSTAATTAVVPGETPADPAPSRSPEAVPEQQFKSTVPSDEKIAAAATEPPAVGTAAPAAAEPTLDDEPKSVEALAPIAAAGAGTAVPAAVPTGDKVTSSDEAPSSTLGQAILPSSEKASTTPAAEVSPQTVAEPVVAAKTSEQSAAPASEQERFVPPSSVVEDDETTAPIAYKSPSASNGPVSSTSAVESDAKATPELAERTGAVAERRDDQVAGNAPGPVQSEPAPSGSAVATALEPTAVEDKPAAAAVSESTSKSPATTGAAAAAGTTTTASTNAAGKEPESASAALASDPTLEPTAQQASGTKTPDNKVAGASDPTLEPNAAAAAAASSDFVTPQKKKVQMQEPSSEKSTPGGQYSTAPTTPQGTPSKISKRKSGFFAKIKSALSPNKSSS